MWQLVASLLLRLIDKPFAWNWFMPARDLFLRYSLRDAPFGCWKTMASECRRSNVCLNA
jgi:hypothetical protein